MVRKYWLLILLLFVAILPAPIQGIFCSNLDKANQRALATNLNISYQENIRNNSANFDITITNITENLIVRDALNNRDYRYGHDRNNPSEITIFGFSDGGSYKFEIYTDLEHCEDDLLHVIYATVPKYNPYYNDELCDGIENYRMCQRWVNFDISYQEFVENVNQYKKSLVIDEEEEPITEVETSIIDYLINFWINYYYYVLGVIIIGCLFVIYRLRNKNKLI